MKKLLVITLLAAATAQAELEPVKKPFNESPSLYVIKGETYYDALQRWFVKEGVGRVGVSLPDAAITALNQRSDKALSIKGTFKQAVAVVSERTGQKINVTKSGKLGAIHAFSGNAEIYITKGGTLKEVVYHLAEKYKWQFEEENWMLKDDFKIREEYILVTPKNDFEGALSFVLNGYPVVGQLLISGRKVFISEKD